MGFLLRSLSGVEQLFFALLFASTFLAAFALSQALSVGILFSFSASRAIAWLFSPSFLFFLLALPLPIALIVVFARSLRRGRGILLAFSASGSALLAANLLFVSLHGFAIVQLAFLASLPLVFETALTKLSELERWVVPRAAGISFRRCALFLQVGLLSLSAFVILPQQEAFVSSVETRAIGALLESGEFQRLSASFTANALVEGQRGLLAQIMALPGFAELGESDDENARLFFQQTLLLHEELSRESVKEWVEGELVRGFGGVKASQLMNALRDSFPVLRVLEGFAWFWVGLFLMSFFSLLVAFVLVPLAMLYAALLHMALAWQTNKPFK